MASSMKIRCPNCHSLAKTTNDSNLDSVYCGSCETMFSIYQQENLATLEHRGALTTMIGHFELLDQIGVGGHGTVWKAKDNELDRIVAIKIPRRRSVSVESEQQFLREARAAAQLNHPGIVTIHEVGRDDDRLYIVSDFVDGVDLSEWLSAKRMTFQEAVRFCGLVADALEHAHQKGVVHRDLKPGNIMLGENNAPLVMDFGLAKQDVGEVTMTMDGRIIGTPAYMSPEQARGEGHRVDRRADIYSLGVILYELLTGEWPFRGVAKMLIQQVISDDPISPRRLVGAIPKDLETIVMKCLEKSPDSRYQTAAELKADLNAWLSHEPIRARPVGTLGKLKRWRQRNPVVANLTIGFFFMLALMVLVSGTYAYQAKQQASQLAEQKNDVTEAQSIVALQRAALSNILAMIDDSTGKDGMISDEILLEAALICSTRIGESEYEEMAERFIKNAHQKGVFDEPERRTILLTDPGLSEIRKRKTVKAIVDSLSE